MNELNFLNKREEKRENLNFHRKNMSQKSN